MFGTRLLWLGDLGMLVIRLLKALATPLILFAVLDARRERDAWARADDEPGRGARHTETEEHRPAHVPTILWKC